jgi:hypothetical protein
MLAAIDVDRARAIVKATDHALTIQGKSDNEVELVEVTPGLAVIVVGPCNTLKKVSGLQLVEVAPMRFLLAIPSGTPIDSLELALTDLLEDDKKHGGWEHSTLSKLKDMIRSLRRRGLFSKAEMLFIDTRAMKDEAGTEPKPVKTIKRSSPKSRRLASQPS